MRAKRLTVMDRKSLKLVFVCVFKLFRFEK